MLQQLINHNNDIKRLIDKGYDIEFLDAHLVVHHIPYVNHRKEVSFGKLVTTLNHSGYRTLKPETHVIHFIGDCPCDSKGNELKKILHERNTKRLSQNLTINYSFSSKPKSGYSDYFEKINTYSTILSSHAKVIDKDSTEFTFKVRDEIYQNSVFYYLDTNSSRAGINLVTSKMYNQKIAIIGLGGTGSYLLDFIAKNPVEEIHLFDDDDFEQHNAFRAPGAPNLSVFSSNTKKVQYFKEIYSNMHKNIKPHAYYIDVENLNELLGIDFVFICVDKGNLKKSLFEFLLSNKIPFADVGMGIQNTDNSLTGILRVTTGTSQKNDHLKRHISYSDSNNDDYSKNIQIAELNALNAAMAIIKWKKETGFYHDNIYENSSFYTINANALTNEDFNP